MNELLQQPSPVLSVIHHLFSYLDVLRISQT
jgi:hypothetical protein